MKHCVVCSGRHYVGETHWIDGSERSFCIHCWNTLRELTRTDDERRDERIVDAIMGYRHVVINTCYGSFGMSHTARLRYLELTGKKFTLVDRESRDSTLKQGPKILVGGAIWHDDKIRRDDELLVGVVQELQEESWGPWSELKVVKIPGDVDWFIDQYDGKEFIRERHRMWS